MRTALVLVTLAACQPVPAVTPAPPRSAFGCSGAPTVADPIDPTPPRFELRKLREGPEGIHLELVAEAATAAQLAARLGQVLGKPMLLADGLAAYRFTFYLPDVTPAELDTTLAASTGVRILERDDLLVLQPPGGGTRFAPDVMAVEARIVTPKGKQTPEQIAALFCRSFASPAGTAQVVGDDVVVSDRRPYLDRLGAVVANTAR